MLWPVLVWVVMAGGLRASDSEGTRGRSTSAVVYHQRIEDMLERVLANQMAILDIINCTKQASNHEHGHPLLEMQDILRDGFDTLKNAVSSKGSKSDDSSFHNDVTASLREVMVTLREHKLTIQEEISALKTGINAQVRKAEDSGMQLREAMVSMRDVIASTRDVQQIMQKDLASLKHALSSRGGGGQLDRVQQQLLSLSSSVSYLEGEREQDRRRHAREIQQLQLELTTLHNNTSSCEEENEALVKDVQELRTTMTELNTNLINRCYMAGRLYKNGDLIVNANCSISICQQGVPQPYQGISAPNVCFSELVKKKCIHLEPTRLTWAAARTNCRKNGGDLFVAGDLSGALQYLREHSVSEAWIGARSRQWIDGRPISTEAWWPEEPNGGYRACVWAGCGEGSRAGVGDGRCSVRSPSLCQIGTSFS